MIIIMHNHVRRTATGKLAQLLLLCVMCLTIAHAQAQNYTSSQFGSSASRGEYSDVARVQATSYSNNYDGVLSFQCPKGHAVYYVHSVHNNYYEDRKWTFKCRKAVRIGYPVTCESGMEDKNWDWDKKLHFPCPWNSYIGGIYSYHNNYYNDRKWTYTCCSAPCHEYDLRYYYTAKSNYDATFTEEVTGEEDVFRGMYSDAANNYYE